MKYPVNKKSHKFLSVIFAVLLFFQFDAQAQAFLNGTAIRVDLGVGQTAVRSTADYNNRARFTGGFSVHTFFDQYHEDRSSMVSLVNQINFQNPAYHHNDFRFSLNYITYSPSACLHFNKLAIGPFIDAGPFASYNIGASYKENTSNKKINYKNEVKAFTGGIKFGAGLSVLAFLNLEYRYYLGIADMFKNNSGKFGLHTFSIGIIIPVTNI